jgi:non-lysosomal glucosylceramidase
MKLKTKKLANVSFPLGGIGTGCIGLSGNGRLKEWQIFNHPDKGRVNGYSHFAIRAENKGRTVDARVLQADELPPYDPMPMGVPRETLAGFPHFQAVEFEEQFPFALLNFKDPAFPGRVSLRAFNPFVPGNDKDSSIPVALFEFTVLNNQKTAMEYTLVGNIANPLDGTSQHRISKKSGIHSMKLEAEGIRGDMCLATDAASTSYQRYWFSGEWFDSLQVYWDDLSRPGPFKDRSLSPELRTKRRAGCAMNFSHHALLASHLQLAPGQSACIRYAISWSFPVYEKYWHVQSDDGLSESPESSDSAKPSWLNYYATQWKNSASSAHYALRHWEKLQHDSRLFAGALGGSSLPPKALEAVAANLCILKSPTVLRLEDGTLYGWEGCREKVGACEGSCTHVWNYAQALPYLFPAMARRMREVDYLYNQQSDGSMPFRLQLPLGTPNRTGGMSCADGLFGNVMLVYRDWKISGDDAWMASLWPSIKKSFAWAWDPASPMRWDPAKTGILHGRQHHTLDNELFGPNAWLSGFYLGALKAAALMARHLGEDSEIFETLFERGKSWAAKHLFNGEHFIQRIDLDDANAVRDFGCGDKYWDEASRQIKYQIGEGCGIDQVVAQWHADQYGLGDLFEPAQVRSALRAIYRHNFRRSFRNDFNACRIYALNDEGGVIMVHWPEGARKPAIPITYDREVMTGFEYAYADHLIRRGMTRKGLSVVERVRHRYDGNKRNPFAEVECGYYYARAMSSYALLLSFSGFHCDRGKGEIGFNPIGFRKSPTCQFFWSLEGAWGVVKMTRTKLTLAVHYGSLEIKRFGLPDGVRPTRAAVGGTEVLFTASGTSLMLKRPRILDPQHPLQIKFKIEKPQPAFVMTRILNTFS